MFTTDAETKAGAINAIAGPLSVAMRLDRLPASPRLFGMIAILSFGAFFEIYDLGLTAPLGLGLTKAGVLRGGAAAYYGQALFAASTFLGLYLGTLGISRIADRYGRRPVFTWSLLLYAVATVVMGTQNSALMIDLWRLIAGIGIGVELVVIDCYIAELTPKHLRGRAFAVSSAIQFLSAPAVAILAWKVLPAAPYGIAGWRWLCFVPAFAALAIWIVRMGLPESPRWLEQRGRIGEAIAIVEQLERHSDLHLAAEPTPQVSPAPVQIPAGRFGDLWKRPVRLRTTLMIFFHSLQVIGYFGFTNWLPTLLVAEGVSVTSSLGYGAAISLSMPIAPMLYFFVADRIERKWQIMLGAFGVAAFGYWFSRLSSHSPGLIFITLGAAIAMSNSLMSYSYHAYQGEIFPTNVRAQAVGFVYSFSRLSAMLSGFLIAFVLQKAGTNGVLVLISGAMTFAGLAIGVFGPRTRGVALENLAPSAGIEADIEARAA